MFGPFVSDVVPCEASTLSQWVHPPYSGHCTSDNCFGLEMRSVSSLDQLITSESSCSAQMMANLCGAGERSTTNRA